MFLNPLPSKHRCTCGHTITYRPKASETLYTCTCNRRYYTVNGEFIANYFSLSPKQPDLEIQIKFQASIDKFQSLYTDSELEDLSDYFSIFPHLNKLMDMVQLYFDITDSLPYNFYIYNPTEKEYLKASRIFGLTVEKLLEYENKGVGYKDMVTDHARDLYEYWKGHF